MLFRILIIVFILFIQNSAIADVYAFPSDLKTVYENIPVQKSIKCKFRQEKYIPSLKKPLISGGDFEFIVNKGVYFYTKYPVESTVDYTNEKYRQINEIAKAISSKKYAKIQNEFDFYFEKTSNDWILGLKPKKNSDSYKYIVSITINGAEYIKKIAISQTNGNKILLWFVK